MDQNPENLFGTDVVDSTRGEGNALGDYRDALNFDLDDSTFLKYAKQLRKDADSKWNEKGVDGLTLAQRRARNVNFLFGRQFAGKKRKKYGSTAQDNILWEAGKYLRSMATSKLPDITITPGNETDEAKEMAQQLSRVTTTDLQRRERKRVLGLAFEHIPPYLVGIIKCFWNPQKGRYGDFDFKVVPPDLVTLDPRSASNDTKDMEFTFETVEYSVKELMMMFPTKKEELFKELRRLGKFSAVGSSGPNEGNQKGLLSKIKIEEVWFKWYDQPTDDKEKWEEVIGVGWYLGNLLFDKIKHPYWDWSGTPQTFTYKIQELGNDTFKREKTPSTIDDLQAGIAGDNSAPQMQTETVFHNHLDYPEFPYIVLGANQWGNSPIDATSDLEQAIPLQENYDKRSRQEDEIIDRTRGKHIFSAGEGLNKDDIANMDMSDPEQDVLIKGDVTKAHKFIAGEQPSPALIQDKNDSRERIFDKRGVHQATRGQVADTAATNNQIAREGDFTRMDDYVDDTINYAAEKMANWEMQFIKLFYTENHLRRILGPDGQWVTVQLHRDLLDDGMEIVISASGSDKLKAEQRAMDMAKMKLIDPYRFYKDIGASDPKGRTLSLLTFLMQPELYMQDIKAGGDGTGSKGVQGAAEVVNGEIAGDGQQGQQGQSPQALQDIMAIQQGQIPPVPTQVDAAYVDTLTKFLHSPEFEQLLAQHPELKAPVLDFAAQVAQVAQGNGAQTINNQPQQPPTPGEQFGQSGAPAGPLAQNPSPDNTSRIAALVNR